MDELFRKDKDNVIGDIREKIVNSLNFKVSMFLYPNEEKNFNERKMESVTPNKIEYNGAGRYTIFYPELLEDKDSKEINILFPDSYEDFDDLYEELLKIKEDFPDKKIWIEYSLPYIESYEALTE